MPGGQYSNLQVSAGYGSGPASLPLAGSVPDVCTSGQNQLFGDVIMDRLPRGVGEDCSWYPKQTIIGRCLETGRETPDFPIIL